MSESLSSAVPLSNDDETVLQQGLDLTDATPATAAADLGHVYELDECAAKLAAADYRRVALQFPDNLLKDAAAVTAALQRRLPSVVFYVLGDTSYGSCCVDEVAAEHVDAQALVHFGRACLSPTAKLPIIYVLGRYPLDIGQLVEQAEQRLPKGPPLLLVTESTYMSSQPDVAIALREAGYQVVETLLQLQTQASRIASTLPGRLYTLQEGKALGDYTLFYMGPPSPTLTTTLMTHTALVAACYSYHPIQGTLKEETLQNAALRRRYATVLKARDAGVIGIVVGTLGVSGYAPLITELKRRIRQAGKKPYLFAMGKLNPAKMANFQEVDLFVLVSCGEHAILMEGSRAFYKPIATPFELLLALAAKPQEAVAWTGRWTTDFEQVMQMPEANTPQDDMEEVDTDAPHFSLLTGTYASAARPMRPASHATDADAALLKVTSDTQLGLVGGVLSPAAAFLNNKKAWTGLGADHALTEEHGEDDSVEKESSVLTEGRTGVARGYN